MMTIEVVLPKDRYAEGEGRIVVDGVTVLGPFRCRGEADNSGAIAHANQAEDPTKAYGDHPYGDCLVTGARDYEPGTDLYRHYGPCFLVLEPIAGEALEAKRNGRSGCGMHGGALHEDGRLRETFGCNRVDDAISAAAGALVKDALRAGERITYTCREGVHLPVAA